MTHRLFVMMVMGLLLPFLMHLSVMAQELILYQDDYQPIKGEIKTPPLMERLTLSSPYGPTQIKTGELLAILSPEHNAAFLKLLQLTNFKTLNRQGLLQSVSLIERFDDKTWQKLDSLFSEKDEKTFLILGYRLYKDGRLENLAVYHHSGDRMLDEAVKVLVSGIRLKPLSKDYTGDWIPGYLILSPSLIRQYGSLARLEEKLLANAISGPVDLSCPYRIRLLYDSSGNAVFHKVLGSKQSETTVKRCGVSENNPVVTYFTTQTLPQIPSIRNDGLTGLSVWVDKNRIRLSYDAEFVSDAVSSAIHHYIYSQVDPAASQYFKKIQKQQKIKFDKRSTRHARYLVTLAPSSWPYLKAVKLTTPSGDKTFDEVCTKALTGMKLPKLPPILSKIEQETVFKCELWGKD